MRMESATCLHMGYPKYVNVMLKIVLSILHLCYARHGPAVSRVEYPLEDPLVVVDEQGHRQEAGYHDYGNCEAERHVQDVAAREDEGADYRAVRHFLWKNAQEYKIQFASLCSFSSRAFLF